jgi:hypothetical protein
MRSSARAYNRIRRRRTLVSGIILNQGTLGRLHYPQAFSLIMDDAFIQEMDSTLTRLFQPDELAAHQYHRNFERVTPLEPERRLMLAVLQDAIACFQTYLHAKRRKEKKLHEDAVSWIFNESDDRVFSFESVCSACGLNPDYLQVGLSKWRDEMNRVKNAAGKARHGARHVTRKRKEARSFRSCPPAGLKVPVANWTTNQRHDSVGDRDILENEIGPTDREGAHPSGSYYSSKERPRAPVP